MPVPETRTHVVLPAELLEAAREAAGSLAKVNILGWETSESIAQWVHDLRQEDLNRLDDLDRLREVAPARL